MRPMVEYCELAPDLKISRILTGLWQIADMEKDGIILEYEETAKAMEPYYDAGLTSFDMADHYGSAEIIAGTFRKKQLTVNPVQLLTKWVPKPGQKTKADVQSAVDLALERMQLDAIDLLQFHTWDYADPNWLDCLFWLQELKEEGFIKNIGLTNFNTAHLRIALTSGIDVVSNQVCYSLIDQRADGKMEKLCKEFDLKILAFGTLAGGFLSEKWVDHAEPSTGDLSTWSEMKYKRFIDVTGGWKKFQPLLKVLQEIAKKHAVSISNIATKYILDKPSVGGVIIGARLGKKDYIKENLKVFEIKLDEADKKMIHEIQSQFDPVHGDCGDEYRKAPILTATGDLTHHLDVSATPFTPIKMSGGRVRVNSGTVWEDFGGYSRAVRKGNQIAVSGTTASHGERLIGGSDPVAQAHFVIDKIQGVIESLGGHLEDIVRTRVYVNNIKDWELVAQVHRERFGDIQPANTLVEARLVGKEYLVEMEVDAIIDSTE